jgi:hypothetical protein
MTTITIDVENDAYQSVYKILSDFSGVSIVEGDYAQKKRIKNKKF